MFETLEFYWIRKGFIAGSSRPSSVEDMNYIAKQGIKRIISISQPEMIKEFAKNFPIEVIPFSFKDFGIPDAEQVKKYFSIIKDSLKDKTPILIHCAMGCGRTGLLLTLYLMKFENKTFPEALTDIRKIRPCAVESQEQFNYLATINIENFK
jgi:protein-tyrosine phosphatase